MPTSFPDDFLWGTATSSYQIEGAVEADGRKPSIWDEFSHSEGATQDGGTGDVACDHYHRWREDVALMRDLGVDAYRFSVAWPRVLPEGTGAVNHAGLDFYDRLVDALLDAGITPCVTLYHWDLPLTLQREGGWTVRPVVSAFADYADAVARRLGDRVGDWITHNEPWVAAFLGHYYGEHAPGHQNLDEALQVAHHLLVSHGAATQSIRASIPDANVGITLNLTSYRPASILTSSGEDPSDAEHAAVRRADGFQNRWFLDPVYGRGYPDDLLDFYGDRGPDTETGDVGLMGVDTDFLGINYYRPSWVRPAPDAPLGFEALGPDELADHGYTITEMGWPVDPSGLGDVLRRVTADYPLEHIYITENGAAFPDTVEDGAVQDRQRIAYLSGHLQAVADAADDGVPVDGYFAWSLLDNFEWERGYTKRFGLIRVDYDTLKRLPKASAHWYRSVIDAHVLPDDAPPLDR